jgi:hypothetical protein
MTLKEKVSEYKKIKAEIKELYTKKNAIEKTIIDELNRVDLDTYERIDEITLDDSTQLALAYENEIDTDLVREKYPSIYNFGQKLYFSWSQAVLSFADAKDFWRLMKDCRVKKPKLKVKEDKATWKKNYTKNLEKK